MRPYYEQGGIQIWHGRWEDVLPSLDVSGVDLVLTDPPYGMQWDGRVQRGPSDARHGTMRDIPTRHFGVTVEGDNQPFDPSPWLGFPRVVLWGYHHFAQRLPVGSLFVWLKRYDNGFGSFLSDAETAWMKGGCGVYCHRDVSLQGESSQRRHPTEKPVGLMRWCIAKAGCPAGGLILDPYMGSGPVARAVKDMGRRYIGIECVEQYAEAAARRLSQEAMVLEAV